MSNVQNLKSFQPGQSGNPNGRPKGSRNISTVLTQMLGELAPDVVIDSQFIKQLARSRKNVTLADAAALRIVYEGVVNGESWALKEISDRTEGKARQFVDITAKGDIDVVEKAIIQLLIRKRNEAEANGKSLPTNVELRDLVSKAAVANNVDANQLIERLNLN